MTTKNADTKTLMFPSQKYYKYDFVSINYYLFDISTFMSESCQNFNVFKKRALDFAQLNLFPISVNDTMRQSVTGVKNLRIP